VSHSDKWSFSISKIRLTYKVASHILITHTQVLIGSIILMESGPASMDWSSFEKWIAHPVMMKIWVIILVILFLQTVSFFFRRYISGLHDPGTRYRLRKVSSFGQYLIIILFVSILFSESMGKLTIIMGVAGAGIAFALQEVIVSLAGWLAISFGNFYKTGDRIQLGGIKGDVIDIGILRTTLMEIGEWVKSDQYNGRIVQIANSFVFKEPVFNYSGDFPFLWDEVVVPIKYGSDYHLARQILLDTVDPIVRDFTEGARLTWQTMVAKYMIEDAPLDPMVSLVANDNWMEFAVRYVVDYKSRRRVRDRIFTALLDEIGKTDGRVSIASATFHLVEAPVFDVRLRGENGRSIP
jgi:small-conductance mechanosensitive channel